MEQLVRSICDYKQAYTQYGGKRATRDACCCSAVRANRYPHRSPTD